MTMAFLADGVYTNVQGVVTATAGGNPNLPSVAIGTGSWGKLNTPIPIGTPSDAYDAFGNVGQAASDLPAGLTLYCLASQAMGKTGNAFGIRVDDGTSTAASVTSKDGQVTPGNHIVFTGACNGTRANGGTVQFSKAANYTSTQPVYNLALSIPTGSGVTTEVFTNLVAWKNTSGTNAYDSTTFVASVLAAVNNGQSRGRAKSKYWIASAAGTVSSFAPAETVFTASGGTDGSGVSASQLIGTDGITGRTGMYAARGLKFGQFSIIGLQDFTVAGTMAAFAQSVNAFAVGPVFPTGTSTTACLTTKLTNNVSSVYQGVVKNWLYWFDTTIGYQRLVSPDSVALGIIGGVSPEQSPGNKPVLGLPFVLGTELGTVPVSSTEAAQLAQAGVMSFGSLPRQDSLLGLVNGQNASGTPGLDGVNYTRLTNYISTVLTSGLGEFVDELQGSSAKDDLRRRVAAKCDGFLNDLKRNNQIDNFKTTCDLTNNSLVSIAAGQLNVLVLVKYLGTARFINLSIVGGVGVTINQPATA